LDRNGEQVRTDIQGSQCTKIRYRVNSLCHALQTRTPGAF
jgi:hypothetical protein